MDANRFAEFRGDLYQVYQTIQKDPEITDQLSTVVDKLFQELTQKYPELVVKREEGIESKLEQLHLNSPTSQQPPVETATVATASAEKRKKRVKKSREEVKEILVASIKNTDSWKNYTDIPIKTNTEQECIKTLHLLNKAIIDAKKRIIFFSALQGQVLYELKEVSKCSMSDLLKKTDYSQSHVNFLIRLPKLIVNNNKLRHSDLPLSFFKENMSTINQICEEEDLFKY